VKAAAEFLHCSRCDVEAPADAEPAFNGGYLCDTCAQTMIVRDGVVVSVRRPCAECGDVQEVEPSTQPFVCDECADEIAETIAAEKRAAASRLDRVVSIGGDSSEVESGASFLLRAGALAIVLLAAWLYFTVDEELPADEAESLEQTALTTAITTDDCNVVTRQNVEFRWPRRADGWCYETDAQGVKGRFR
jgi:hypothetical protein